jgi:lysophospholipase L1-like esterase
MKLRCVLVCAGYLMAWTASSGAQEATRATIDPRFALPASDEGLPGAGPIRRYDRFQQTWGNRRAEFARQREADQGAVVLLGDSITQGWGSRLTGFFPGVKFANRGISGDTTRGMLWRLKEDVLDLNPKAVVMLMGTNDLEEQAEPAVIAGNLRLILAEIKKFDPHLPIVLCLVFPSSASKMRPAAKIQAVNDLYLAAVKGDPQVTVIDSWTLFADANGDARSEDFKDLLHLNDEGYRKWAAALRPILATLGFCESEADPFVMEPGFQSLFNGKDLTGWGYRPTTAEQKAAIERSRAKKSPTAPAWSIVEEAVSFAGQVATPDGRYVAKHGRLVVTTPPEGRKIQQLWTLQEFPDDFELKLEFRATPNADSGVFIRQPQLQCRDYPLAGPYKELKAYRPQDWNELVVEVRGQTARCTCNGELLEAEFKLPATGPIGLEGDRGQMEYRRLRWRPLP